MIAKFIFLKSDFCKLRNILMVLRRPCTSGTALWHPLCPHFQHKLLHSRFLAHFPLHENQAIPICPHILIQIFQQGDSFLTKFPQSTVKIFSKLRGKFCIRIRFIEFPQFINIRANFTIAIGFYNFLISRSLMIHH